MIKRYTITTIGNPETFKLSTEIKESEHGQFVKYEDVKEYLPNEQEWHEWLINGRIKCSCGLWHNIKDLPDKKIEELRNDYNKKYEKLSDSLSDILKISRFEAMEILNGIIELIKTGVAQ